jgi:excisionase family DNA binding protein
LLASANGKPVTYFSLSVPAELIGAIADRAAEIVLSRLEEPRPAATEYMTVLEAAEHLRCSRQRVDDLLSQRRLTRYKDGARTLVSRAEIERYVRLDSAATSLPPPPRSPS